MKIALWLLYIIGLSVAIAASVYFWNQRTQSKVTENNSEDAPGEKREEVADIKVTPIKKASISEEIKAYGTVIPAPGALQTISLPFECQVCRVLITEGQRVSEGGELVKIKPSPDTRLQMEEAEATYKSEKQRFKQVQDQFKLKLVTNEEVLHAEQAFREAELRLQSLKKRGIGDEREIRAVYGGIVAKVYVREGSIVAAGNPLLEIASEDRLEIRLGVEPEDVKYLQENQSVLLTSVNRPLKETAEGKIRALCHAVNSKTRLVNVFVPLPQPGVFLLGEYVRGRINAGSRQTLVVPREAVLPEDGKYVLFTLEDGHAVKHTVRIGIESSKEVEVICDELKAGDLTVILGNYELKDGMAVNIKSDPK